MCVCVCMSVCITTSNDLYPNAVVIIKSPRDVSAIDSESFNLEFLLVLIFSAYNSILVNI